MHSLRIATWNAEGMFVEGAMTRRASPHDAIATLKLLSADIVVIPEFGVNGKVSELTRVAIQSLGYQIIEVPYNDPTMPEHVPKEYEMALLSRLPLRSHTLHHFHNSGRGFIEAIVELPGGKDVLRIFGVHLDDKAESLRLAQSEQIISLLSKPHIGGTLLMGDFNAMSNHSIAAKVLRTKPAEALGSKLPTKQLRSVSARVHEMATGTTIAMLQEHPSLHNLDPTHQFTISAKQLGMEWAPAIRLAKIDWIFGSKNITAIKYKVLSDIGSDHRPVVADIIII